MRRDRREGEGDPGTSPHCQCECASKARYDRSVNAEVGGRAQTFLGREKVVAQAYSIQLYLAPKTWSFLALPPVDLLAGFDLNVEFWPGALLQEVVTAVTSSALSSERPPNSTTILSRAVCRMRYSVKSASAAILDHGCKGRQPTITALDDAARSTLQIVDCRPIVPTWAFRAQTGKVTQVITDERRRI